MRFRNIICDSGTPFCMRSSIAWLAELPAEKSIVNRFQSFAEQDGTIINHLNGTKVLGSSIITSQKTWTFIIKLCQHMISTSSFPFLSLPTSPHQRTFVSRHKNTVGSNLIPLPISSWLFLSLHFIKILFYKKSFQLLAATQLHAIFIKIQKCAFFLEGK